MQIRSHSAAVLLALTATLALAGCKKKDEAVVDAPPAPVASEPAPTAPAPTPAPVAAISVTGVTVGTSAAADKSVAPVAMPGSKDPIIVSIKTDGAASNVAITAKLTYQDGQVAGEQGATLTTSGAETTNVTFSNPNGWPPGKYKAEVTLDGKPAGMPQEFEVTK